MSLLYQHLYNEAPGQKFMPLLKSYRKSVRPAKLRTLSGRMHCSPGSTPRKKALTNTSNLVKFSIVSSITPSHYDKVNESDCVMCVMFCPVEEQAARTLTLPHCGIFKQSSAYLCDIRWLPEVPVKTGGMWKLFGELQDLMVLSRLSGKHTAVLISSAVLVSFYFRIKSKYGGSTMA